MGAQGVAGLQKPVHGAMQWPTFGVNREHISIFTCIHVQIMLHTWSALKNIVLEKTSGPESKGCLFLRIPNCVGCSKETNGTTPC